MIAIYRRISYESMLLRALASTFSFMNRYDIVTFILGIFGGDRVNEQDKF